MLAKKALAGTAGAPKVYVEDVFSTYLYTGTGSTAQTINNNINLSSEGGLVWMKKRGVSATESSLFDTARGRQKYLISSSTNAEANTGTDTITYNTNGFSLNTGGARWNEIDETYVSWTFRKAKKFFDVVTYTGNGTAGRAISHNLGSTPGCVIVKATDLTQNWTVYHRSVGGTKALVLNSTAAADTDISYWNNSDPTSTTFIVGGNGGSTNNNGTNYVAYLFAHDAGGFGDAGSDNVISCGSLTTDASGISSVNLGYEPQWLLLKGASGTNPTTQWIMFDTMRGWTNPANNARLFANLSNAETSGDGQVFVTSTGFGSPNGGLGASTTYIYIAIRRGPMKTPTSGTSVFEPIAATGSTGTSRTVGFTADLVIGSSRTSGDRTKIVEDRLRGFANSNAIGAARQLVTNTTGAESTSSYPTVYNVWNTTRLDGQYHNTLSSIWWNFRRAPGFFDVVCYTGTGSATTFSHNLGVAPELYIVKRRDSGTNWFVYSSTTGNSAYLQLNLTDASATSSNIWNNTSPTSSVFSVSNSSNVNGSGATYVAYLFASVSGVSKVGSYTGNGSSVTVTTGFQPRFIMVKRTDSTGNWIVSDSARGLVAGNDPYLLLNSTAAEDTDEDWVDVSSTGFTVNETSTANANVNTGTYIYLAIA